MKGGMGSTLILGKLRDRFVPALTLVLFLLLLGLLVLSPADTRLGNIVKVAYLHGALNWAGLFTFSIAGILGLLALLLRRPGWYRGTQAAACAALIVWTVYILSSVLVTGLTWGQWVAWNEPRVRATALILLAAVVFAMVGRLVDQRDFGAGVNLLMGILPWIVIGQADAIRHPADPIGGSDSAAIQLFFRLIMLATVGLAISLIAWLWINLELRAESQSMAPDTAPE